MFARICDYMCSWRCIYVISHVSSLGRPKRTHRALLLLVVFICSMLWLYQTTSITYTQINVLPHTWTGYISSTANSLKDFQSLYAKIILTRLSVPSEIYEGEIRIFLLLHNFMQSISCPGVPTCVISTEMSYFSTAHLAIFHHAVPTGLARAFPEQRWVYATYESPFNAPYATAIQLKEFDWFTTVHPTSTVPYTYALYIPFINLSTVTSRHSDGTSKVIEPTNSLHALLPSFHKDRTKKVVWVVSNPNSRSQRNEYAKELSKYIQVDILGSAFRDRKRFCPNVSNEECFQKLSRQYKFYLAFENSLCRYYITEKYFENALITGMVPVVLGAPRGDYDRFGPPNSYIHVDSFANPRKLAQYLTYLDQNDTAYAEYFVWKKEGYVKIFGIEHLTCQYCHILHSEFSRGITRRRYHSESEFVVANYISQKNQSCIESARWPFKK